MSRFFESFEPAGALTILSLLFACGAASATPPPIQFASRQLYPDVGDHIAVGQLDDEPGFEIAGAKAGQIFVLRGVLGSEFSGPDSMRLAGGPIVALKVRDLDGNGHDDLVSLQESPATLRVLRRQIGFAFSVPEVYAVPTGSASVEFADLNGDLRLDAVVLSPDSLCVLFGGDGRFLSRVDRGDAPHAMASFALGDVNCDSIADLVAIYRASGPNHLGVGLGNGDGTFTPPVLLADENSGFSHVMLADMDADGDLDVVAVDTSHPHWFENSGTGAFSHHGPYFPESSSPSWKEALGVGDIDGDGLPEVATSGRIHTYVDENLLVFVGHALGDDARQGTARWHVPGALKELTIADVNGDGWSEIVGTCGVKDDGHEDSDDPTTFILWNRGDGLLLGREEILVSSPPLYARAARGVRPVRTSQRAFADFVVTERDTLFLIRNQSPGVYRERTPIGLGEAAAVVDLNEDGEDDLLFYDGSCRLRSGDGVGFGPTLQVAEWGRLCAPAEFNGDQHPDLLLLTSAPELRICLGLGGGAFAAPITVQWPAIAPHLYACADFDGDGRDEIFHVPWARTSGEYGEQTASAALEILYLDSFGAVVRATTDSMSFFGASLVTALDALVGTDVDGDGDRDVIFEFGRGADFGVAWWGDFINDGAGHLSLVGTHYGDYGGKGFVTADWNLDGMADFATHEVYNCGTYAYHGYFYTALGGGAFSEAQTIRTTGCADGSIVGDFDGDGRPDVGFTDGYFGLVTLLYNASPLAPTPAQLALVSSRFENGAVVLEWFAPEGGTFTATVERRVADGEWGALASVVADGAGHVTYRDAAVAPGRRYAYRLRYSDGAVERTSVETWVDVPRPAFAMRALGAVPGDRLPAFALTVPRAGEVTLALYDVSGRLVRSARRTLAEAGEVRLELSERALSAGLYFARAQFEGQTNVTRVILFR